MLHRPATRPAITVGALYEIVQSALDTKEGDVPTESLMTLYRELADRYDTDLSSPLNMGYFCLDPDPDSVAAMDEANRRGANISVKDQHPASVAFEELSIDLLLRAFAMDPQTAIGHFTSCGTEANLTALIVALCDRLTHRNPRCANTDPALCVNEAGETVHYEYAEHGTLPLRNRPTVYVTEQTHRSVAKNVRNVIGHASLRRVPATADLRMDVVALDEMVEDDAAAGLLPFLVVGTVGATPSGIIDPLPDIADVCRRQGLWFHVDAPWGGIAALSPVLRERCLAGVNQADSLIFDPHKTLVPLGAGGAGMYLCRHRPPVEQAFNVSCEPVERYNYGCLSLQGSRAHIGLRVLTALVRPRALAARIEFEVELGEQLRTALRKDGWRITSDTPLPVVCAIHPTMEDGGVRAEDAVSYLAEQGVLAKADRLRKTEPMSLRLGVISRQSDASSIAYVADCLRAFIAERSR